jgi:hypothetical protein
MHGASGRHFRHGGLMGIGGFLYGLTEQHLIFDLVGSKQGWMKLDFSQATIVGLRFKPGLYVSWMGGRTNGLMDIMATTMTKSSLIGFPLDFV